MISGFTIARNVVKMKYPFEQWAQSMANLNLGEVVIGYDPTTDDGTHELMLETRDKYGFRLFESVWDMDNFKGGTELGIQTDKTMDQLRSDWHLYVQLDEAFHEDDVGQLKALVESPPEDVTGFDFLRVYFFGNLHTIRKDWSVQITRLTRKGTHRYSGFDGMNCEPVVQGRHDVTSIWMWHYSRMGDPQEISQRLRNLDGFYHEPDTLMDPTDLPDYDFKTRQWDNFSKIENPPEVDSDLLKYLGTHPLPFAELYQDYE